MDELLFNMNATLLESAFPISTVQNEGKTRRTTYPKIGMIQRCKRENLAATKTALQVYFLLGNFR
jgi:hypothetical protein